MKYLFELSGEHPDLPRDEVLACLEARRIRCKVLEEDDKLLALDIEMDATPLIEFLKNRLSMTFFIDEFYYSCEASEKKILEGAGTIKIPEDKTFRITAYRIRSRHKELSLTKVVSELGGIIKGKARMKNPDIEVVLAISNRAFAGRRIHEFFRGEFDKRGTGKRPFSLPISLHPRIAMALVNLSRIESGQTLLDPFCGTGGILIEAARAGARLIGSDIDPRMIEGAKRNLEYFGVGDANLFQSDVSDIQKHVSDIDAVVTDLPYGRAASMHKKSIEELYYTAFRIFADVLKEGKRAVVGISDRDKVKIGERYLRLEKVYPLRVHKSLTRYFCVFVK